MMDDKGKGDEGGGGEEGCKRERKRFSGSKTIGDKSFRHRERPRWLAYIHPRESTTVHSGLGQPRIETQVLGHSLLHLFVCSHRTLIYLLCTARFTSTLRCAQSFAHSLISYTSKLVEK